ncbi:MAG: hypothetical protein ACO1SX_14050 [Actinomycetota bacterium]
MKTRQFVWTRPEIIDEARKSFVTVAANDVAIRQSPEKQKLEYRLVDRMFRDQREGIHQGLYVVTSSGRFLARVNAGWPDPDPVTMLRNMRSALAEYRRLPASERVLTQAVDVRRDGLTPQAEMFRKAPGTLELRVVRRSYPFAGMTSFDVRHPMYFAIDRLWYKPSEYGAWVPLDRRVGATATVRGPALDRLIMLSHLLVSQNPWQPGDVRRGEMTSRVTAVDGARLTLRITAEIDVKANTQWNQGAYTGNLIGRAVYDTGSRRFSEFELLSLGTHTQSPMQPNMHAGSPTSRVGALITLNPQNDPDNQMLPSQWRYGYPRGWSSTP